MLLFRNYLSNLQIIFSRHITFSTNIVNLWVPNHLRALVLCHCISFLSPPKIFSKFTTQRRALMFSNSVETFVLYVSYHIPNDLASPIFHFSKKFLKIIILEKNIWGRSSSLVHKSYDFCLKFLINTPLTPLMDTGILNLKSITWFHICSVTQISIAWLAEFTCCLQIILKSSDPKMWLLQCFHQMSIPLYYVAQNNCHWFLPVYFQFWSLIYSIPLIL